MAKKAFFLDKDGTIVSCKGFPDIIPTNKIMKEKVIHGLRFIQEKGYLLFIVSNQKWISRGDLSKEEVEKIFSDLVLDLEKEGVFIEEYVYCEHQSKDNCDCKKPKGKMVLDLAEKHDVDLDNSFVVGDLEKDILMGKEIGVKTILVDNGEGKKFKSFAIPDYFLKDLNEVWRVFNES